MLRKTPKQDFIDNLHWFSNGSEAFELTVKLEKNSVLNKIIANADCVILTVRNDKPFLGSASKKSSWPMRANEWIALAKTVKIIENWIRVRLHLFLNMQSYLSHFDPESHISLWKSSSNFICIKTMKVWRHYFILELWSEFSWIHRKYNNELI